MTDMIRQCRQSLAHWGHEKNRGMKERIEKQKVIVEMAGRSGPGFSMDLFYREEKQLNALLDKEERFLRRRSRASWMKCGDKNTKFFQRKATARKKRNTIRGLFDEREVWRCRETEVADVVAKYFEDIFTSAGPSMRDIEAMVDGIQPRISEKMNYELERPFEIAEVRSALFAMDPIKAPGKDGFPAIFYQKYWDVVGESVSEACLGILNEGR